MREIFSVAAAIYNANRDRVITVKRPLRDEDPLAGLWGLPAATAKDGETEEQAVVRIGPQKLGTTIKLVKPIHYGELSRPSGEQLCLRLWECDLESPDLPPDFTRRDTSDRQVTYYDDWRWRAFVDLIGPARAGSLCSRLFLEKEGIVYEKDQ